MNCAGGLSKLSSVAAACAAGEPGRHWDGVPARSRPEIMLSTPSYEGSTCKPPARETGRIINVPPMSNHRRTCADVMALDHQADLAA